MQEGLTESKEGQVDLDEEKTKMDEYLNIRDNEDLEGIASMAMLLTP